MNNPQFNPTNYLDAVLNLREVYDLLIIPNEYTEKFKNVIRASVIKNFELVYELTLKTLFRRLQIQANLPELQVEKFERTTFEDLVRLGGEGGYLQYPEQWPDFKKMRNKSVHTYAEKTAAEVLHGIPNFLAEAEHFAKILREEA